MSAESWLSFFKILSIVATLIALLSSVGIFICSSKIDKAKATKIAALEKEARRLSRGITVTYSYAGVRRESSGGVFSVVADESPTYRRLVELGKTGRFQDVIDLATTQIARMPEWLTPYLFRGGAYAELGQIEPAIRDLEHVVNQAAGDKDYAAAGQMLERLRGRRQ